MPRPQHRQLRLGLRRRGGHDEADRRREAGPRQQRLLRMTRLRQSPAADRRHCRTFTARATTSAAVTKAIADCVIIASFAQRESGMVSVGLKAVAFVNET